MKSHRKINIVGGGLAGLFSVSITYPTDLIRRRLQLQGFDKTVPKYNGILDACHKIFKYEKVQYKKSIFNKDHKKRPDKQKRLCKKHVSYSIEYYRI